METRGYGLGRRAAPDERDAGYPLRALLTPVTRRLPLKLWPLFRTVLDQGPHGTCVGHGWEHWMMAAPTVKKDPDRPPTALNIYAGACANDEWSDNDDGGLDFGTSVRGGAKWLQSEGHIGAYHWSATADEAADWIAGADSEGRPIGGPLVIGVNWYDRMFTPDREGIVRVGGTIAGGHCVTLLGYSDKRGEFYGANSWGIGWGRHGRFWLPAEVLERLLSEGGEAVAAVEVRP